MRRYGQHLRNIQKPLVIIMILVMMMRVEYLQGVVEDRASFEPIKLTFDGEVDSDGAPDPWKVMRKQGRPHFKIVPRDNDDPTKVLFVQSERSSFSLNRKINIDISQRRIVTWSWKATKLPSGADARKSSKNDQALQILLFFKGNKVISYIWDTTAPVGTDVDESVRFFGIGVSIKVLVVESGEKNLGQWTHVTRDVALDYKKLYGRPAPELVAVRVQTNSQHTRSTGAGYIAPIIFAALDEEEAR